MTNALVSGKQTMGILAEQACKWWSIPSACPMNSSPPLLWKHIPIIPSSCGNCQELPSFDGTGETTKKNILARKYKCHLSLYLMFFVDSHRIIWSNKCFFLYAKISLGEYFIQHMALTFPVNHFSSPTIFPSLFPFQTNVLNNSGGNQVRFLELFLYTINHFTKLICVDSFPHHHLTPCKLLPILLPNLIMISLCKVYSVSHDQSQKCSMFNIVT